MFAVGPFELFRQTSIIGLVLFFVLGFAPQFSSLFSFPRIVRLVNVREVGAWLRFSELQQLEYLSPSFQQAPRAGSFDCSRAHWGSGDGARLTPSQARFGLARRLPITVVGIASTITPVSAVNTPQILPPIVTGAKSPKPTQHLLSQQDRSQLAHLCKALSAEAS